MMNGCTLKAVIIAPLRNPKRQPTRIVTTTPRTVAPPPPDGPYGDKTKAPQTDAKAYIEPMDRSIPPVMITTVIPTAIIAKKLVSLAICTSVRALKNLLTDSNAGTFWPASLVSKTLSRLPSGVVCILGSRTEPPKTASSNPSAIITIMRPPSGNFERLKFILPGDDIEVVI